MALLVTEGGQGHREVEATPLRQGVARRLARRLAQWRARTGSPASLAQGSEGLGLRRGQGHPHRWTGWVADRVTPTDPLVLRRLESQYRPTGPGDGFAWSERDPLLGIMVQSTICHFNGLGVYL